MRILARRIHQTTLPARVHDLILVGGGPAGLSTALHLLRDDPALAERTILLERDRYPREKYCAGGLGGRGVAVLRRLGLDVSVPSVPLSGVTIRFADHLATLREPDFGHVVRRIEFDHSLARAAISRGFTVREGAKVEAVEQLADGVRVRLAGGEDLRAKAVVGADGVGGAVRRSAGFSGGRLRAQVIELDTEPLESDGARDLVHFDVSDGTLGGYTWDFPTLVNGEAKVCRGLYLIRNLGADNLHERLRAWLGQKGLDMRRYKLKPFGERGFDAEEPLSKPRVLLTGEAAGIDIATGEGIAQALEYGELTARYVSRAFRKGDLGFADWSRHVRLSGVGQRFWLRTLAYRLFYFHRDRASRLFRENPAILQLYAHQFAGNRVRTRTLARMLRHAEPREIPWALKALFGPPPPGPTPSEDAR